MNRTTAMLTIVLSAGLAWAGDLRIPLPRRSHPTPVQSLNREGVEAVKKQNYEKAKTLFYRAYLLDPDDPFTLNNLGYVAELEGQIDRAQSFYRLAAQNSTAAVIDKSSSGRVEGKTLAEAVNQIGDIPMQVNRANIAVMQLLAQGRIVDAEAILQRTLALDRQNPFTLNNLGIVKELEGEYEQALKCYQTVAASHSDSAAVVTRADGWRGRPISEIAEANARRVRTAMSQPESVEARVARLNVRGVAALNRNDRRAAREYFEQAYRLDPENPFSLNNLGYVAEMDGDRETAQFFYEKANSSRRADVKVGFATNRAAEGQKLFEVAAENDSKVGIKIDEALAVRRRQGGPIVLKRRDHTPIDQPEAPAEPKPPQSQPPQ
jgi:Flp pilus assembly protein TadD